MEKTYQRLDSKFKYFAQGLIGSLWLPLALLAFVTDAKAQSISLISDEETEQLLDKITKPLFDAAGISFKKNNIYIVDDASLNAFVSDGNRLFVHTGTIIAADSANELSGVIAHETGHIAGGHILRQKLKDREMQEINLVSALLAGTAAAASGRGDAAMAVLLGSQSSTLNHYLQYRTSEERSADEYAVKALSQTHQSPQGILTFMKRIAKQNNLNGVDETPYFRTHPVTRERISFFEKALSESAYENKAQYEEEFARVKAKLFAYLNTPEKTLRKYPLTDNSTAAQYARAIAAFKKLQFDTAQQDLDKLLQKEPNNPYFYELKGQIALETGKPNEAEKYYRQAVKLQPNSALLQISLAQAIIENTPTQNKLQEAINLLNKSLLVRPMSFSQLLLARAYGALGNNAAAQYAAAEYSARIGAVETAKHQAEEAKAANPSAQLSLKIDDLLLRLENMTKSN